MERATQERLVGATLLIVAGVIMIPWLLDGKTTEPGLAERELVLPGSSDNGNETRRISLELPGQDSRNGNAVRELDARTVKGVDDTATAMNLPTPASAPSSGTNTSSASTSRRPVVTPAAANTDSDPKPSAPERKASTSEVPARFATRMRESTSGGTATAPKPKPVVAESVSKPSPEAVVQPSRQSSPSITNLPDAETTVPSVRQVATPAPSTGPVSTSSKEWAVQVGSFASKENADRLSDLLKDKSYKAFVMQNVVDGRVLYRVRVGPVADRSEADLLAGALREDRQPARVLSHP